MPRLLKQIIIAAAFFIIVGSIVYLSFMRNAFESMVEPAVLIQPPLILSQRLLKVNPVKSSEAGPPSAEFNGVKDFDYDFLAEVRNPNPDFGATDVSYKLDLFGRSGELIAMKTGSINLLPGQTRYEIISPIIVDKEISSAEFKIIDAAWERLKEFIPQSLFLVKNQEYAFLPLDLGSRLKATLSNNSNFDFDRVDVHVILFNEDNDVLAVSRTDIRTFLAKTDRFFEVKWSPRFSGSVGRMEINAYTNVFKNENFIREHGTQEKFQRFY